MNSAQIVQLLVSEQASRLAGRRYSHSQIRVLSDKMKNAARCSDPEARAVAAGVLYADFMLRWKERTLQHQSESLASTKDLRRQFERLTRTAKPRTSAVLDLCPQGRQLLMIALSERHEYALMAELETGKPISDVREFRGAAADALAKLKEVSRGRREHRTIESFIADIAETLQAFLDIELEARPGSRFRELLAVCAEHCGRPQEYLRDPKMPPKLIRRAINGMKTDSIPFRSFRIMKITH